ncbi:Signal peptidase complex subunit SPC2 [Yarrowia sp. C11]|nr:Signal peptidase complex subunit SPC2 [Yarrowia sp. E02]KAG5369875.1 Signal peptidase complex subunit SPC2 [Yarrowia sp. C11]
MSRQTQAVNLYSTSELKKTSDEHIAYVFKELGYTQDHTLLDVRLAAGYASVILAAASFYLDYTFGFDFARPYLVYTVPLFFVLEFFVSGWLYFKERNVAYVGKKGDTKVTVSTTAANPGVDYKIVVDVNGGKKTVDAKFNDWFDFNGFIVYSKFAGVFEALLEKKDQ